MYFILHDIQIIPQNAPQTSAIVLNASIGPHDKTNKFLPWCRWRRFIICNCALRVLVHAFKTFWVKTKEVTGRWKQKLHNEELHEWYSPVNIIQASLIKLTRNRYVRHVACTENKRNSHRITMERGRAKGKSLPERHRRRWEDKTYLEKYNIQVAEGIHLD
jgi:hypothetical protein